MDIATFTRESELNRQAFESLRAQIRRDFAGKYVVLVHGRILGAATTFDEARSLVAKLEPLPEYYLVFPADGEPNFDLAYDLVGSM